MMLTEMETASDNVMLTSKVTELETKMTESATAKVKTDERIERL